MLWWNVERHDSDGSPEGQSLFGRTYVPLHFLYLGINKVRFI